MTGRRLASFASLLLLFCAGCSPYSTGEEAYSDLPQSKSGAAAPTTASAPAGEARAAREADAGGVTGGPPGAVLAATTTERRIIYTAQVHLVAENLSAAQRSLQDLVKSHDGFIAGTDVGGASGQPRQGTWTMRIPVARFESFMDAVVKVGELQRVHSDSQDVTEEFTDLGARIANKRVEEQRLIEHLKRSTAKLSDILAVEQELSRVREEIERMQGRLRFLREQTELTTVTVSISEVREYLPPERTSFTAQIGRTWSGSLGAMADLGKALVLGVVAILPWIVLLLIPASLGWLLVRRAR